MSIIVRAMPPFMEAANAYLRIYIPSARRKAQRQLRRLRACSRGNQKEQQTKTYSVKRLDSVTLIWHKVIRLEKCESGRRSPSRGRFSFEVEGPVAPISQVFE